MKFSITLFLMELNIAALFDAQPTSLHSMLQWIDTQLKGSGLSDKEIDKVELALEETLTNIISYAYRDNKGIIEIKYRLKPKKFVEFIIKDRGCPFNPLKYHTAQKPATSLEEREEGGLGILFIKNLVSTVEYTRFHKMNILKLVKVFK